MSNVLKFGSVVNLVKLAADPSSGENGQLYYNTVSNKIRQYLDGSWEDVSAGSVSLSGQALNDGEIVVGNGSNVSAAIDTDTTGDIAADHATGLTIKAGVVDNSHIDAAAAIAMSKLEALTASKVLASDGSGVISASALATTDLLLKDGSVALTGDLDANSNKVVNLADGTVASDAVNKGQLDLKLDASEVGVSVASLVGGKVPASQLPNAIMEYQGTWDASTNTPALADGVGNDDEDVGNVYRVSTAGSQDLGSGSISFAVGDYAILNASKVWEKADTTDAVASVNGQTGVVTVDEYDVATARTDLIAASIVDGDTTHAPSGEAVHEALLLKADDSAVVKTVNGVSPTAGAVVIDSDDVAEGSTNLYFTDTRAKTAAVLNTLAGSETDQAPSVSAVNTALAGKLANVVEDTTPQLGGPLDLNGQNLEGVMKRGASGATTSIIEEQYLHSLSLLDAQTDIVIASLGLAHATHEGMEVVYKIKEATTARVRIGTLSIVTNGTDISVVDSHNETGDVGVSFSAVINGANVDVRYSTTSSGNARTMRADVKRFLA